MRDNVGLLDRLLFVNRFVLSLGFWFLGYHFR